MTELATYVPIGVPAVRGPRLWRPWRDPEVDALCDLLLRDPHGWSWVHGDLWHPQTQARIHLMNGRVTRLRTSASWLAKRRLLRAIKESEALRLRGHRGES